jgi:hypothetical protein
MAPLSAAVPTIIGGLAFTGAGAAGEAAAGATALIAGALLLRLSRRRTLKLAAQEAPAAPGRSAASPATARR